MVHYCRWLKVKRGALYCWQGGSLRKSECNACLLAYLVQGYFTKPYGKKLPKTRKELRDENFKKILK